MEKRLSYKADLLLALQDRREKKQRAYCSSADTDTHLTNTANYEGCSNLNLNRKHLHQNTAHLIVLNHQNFSQFLCKRIVTQITLCHDEFSKTTRCVCRVQQIKAVPLPIILSDNPLDCTETAAANSNQDTETELLPRGDRCFPKLPLFMSQIFFSPYWFSDFRLLTVSASFQTVFCCCSLSVESKCVTKKAPWTN